MPSPNSRSSHLLKLALAASLLISDSPFARMDDSLAAGRRRCAHPLHRLPHRTRYGPLPRPRRHEHAWLLPRRERRHAPLRPRRARLASLRRHPSRPRRRRLLPDRRPPQSSRRPLRRQPLRPRARPRWPGRGRPARPHHGRRPRRLHRPAPARLAPPNLLARRPLWPALRPRPHHQAYGPAPQPHPAGRRALGSAPPPPAVASPGPCGPARDDPLSPPRARLPPPAACAFGVP